MWISIVMFFNRIATVEKQDLEVMIVEISQSRCFMSYPVILMTVSFLITNMITSKPCHVSLLL
jgi:hypothetical protein